MHLKGLQEWVEYIATRHTKEIELGLTRVGRVAERLNLLSPGCLTITIGGTNGKGSNVAGLEAIYLAQGYKVGAFTSPYLLRLNEEFRINGKEASDEIICDAFEKIAAACENENLTTFEFNTLAALYIFKEAAIDVMLLEVGLGGRLDAVNIIDADVSVITSIGIDHVDYLGDTREAIAKEKAGILRPNAPAVCGDREPPASLLEHAAKLAAPFFYLGRDFSFTKNLDDWIWSGNSQLENLPLTTLALENMSTVLKVIELTQDKLPVSEKSIVSGLQKVTLPGRIQIFPGKVTRVLDVSHNPAAAAFLKTKLSLQKCFGKTHAVFSMLADKDILGTINAIKELVDVWYIAELKASRAASLDILKKALHAAGVTHFKTFLNITDAYKAATNESIDGDRVLTFGSFYTVAEVVKML